MKKTGKVIIGAVSTAALVGIGFGAWSINTGFASESASPISGVVTEILDYSFGSIKVEAYDTSVVFDAPESYHGKEDLSVAYYVKALPNTGKYVTSYDPYDLSLYENCADDYVPYLNVVTELVDKDGKALDEETASKVNKIIDLPSKVIDYKEWLSSEAKASEKGYLFEFDFAWSEETFGGVNPQVYYDAQK